MPWASAALRPAVPEALPVVVKSTEPVIVADAVFVIPLVTAVSTVLALSTPTLSLLLVGHRVGVLVRHLVLELGPSWPWRFRPSLFWSWSWSWALTLPPKVELVSPESDQVAPFDTVKSTESVKFIGDWLPVDVGA